MTGLTGEQAQTLLGNLDKISESEARLLVSALHEEVRARCVRDGQFYLRFVNTRDEADPTRSIKPFPIQKDYLLALWNVIAREQRVVVAKSRQMLVSWLLCAFCTWWARFIPNQYIVWQTQKKEDADLMVCVAGGSKYKGYLGRMQFIERNLPAWLRQNITESEGKLGYPNGSLIEAQAGGASQVRSKVPSIIVEDEFAFQDEAKGVYQAAAPLIQKQTKFIAVSTPNGMEGNMFAALYHGIQVT